MRVAGVVNIDKGADGPAAPFNVVVLSVGVESDGVWSRLTTAPSRREEGRLEALLEGFDLGVSSESCDEGKLLKFSSLSSRKTSGSSMSSRRGSGNGAKRIRRGWGRWGTELGLDFFDFSLEAVDGRVDSVGCDDPPRGADRVSFAEA